MPSFSKIFLAVIISFTPFLIQGQDEADREKGPWEDVIAAMEKGDARALAENFSTMVDLGLPEKDDSYSKSQGEIIMRDFFRKCPPQSFDVIRTGKISEASLFAICNYIGGKGSYQVSIHLAKENGTYLITRIKFEKDAF
jgi:hypothetical protein